MAELCQTSASPFSPDPHLTRRPTLSSAPVVQELMETDMHRVIRTQDLSDDHAQVRAKSRTAAFRTLRDQIADHPCLIGPLSICSTSSTKLSVRSRRSTLPT